MRSLNYTAARRARRSDESGAVAILVALALTGLLIAAAMVLDFGAVRIDRQMNKASADSAVAAGIRGFDNGTGDGQIYTYAGVCQALAYLRLSQPELAGLPNTSNASGNVNCPPSSGQLSTPCVPGVTNAIFSATHGRFDIKIKSPYLVTEDGFSEESSPPLQNDHGDPPKQGCDQIGVILTETKAPGFGGLATSADLVSTIRSVGRVVIGTDGQGGVALLLLEQTGCGVISINGAGSFVRVFAREPVPGFIHSDSDGTTCTGQSRILAGDHPSGIFAEASGSLPGVIRVRAIGTAQNERAYDSATNVVAEQSAPTSGPLVTRRPVDLRYRVGVRAAISDYEAQVSTSYSQVFNCTTATKAQLEAVPKEQSIWINCTTGSKTFSTNNVTLASRTIYFNADKVQAENLSMPNATRVYVKGADGTAINVRTTLKMHQDTRSGCNVTPPVLTPSGERARLIIGAGTISSSSTDSLMLCDTTVILRGGQGGGCVPATDGTPPTAPACDGRIDLKGPTDWTAPSTTSGPVTDPALHSDLEDLAMWTEAAGAHDIGGTGVMKLSGVFFVPNGEFRVHGGSTQIVENTQYVTRKFLADGGSVLEMSPNPNDIVTIPIFGGFYLVR